ncbi:uncharacterized protein LOC143990351 [Lithobates pipiens]
MKVASIFLLLGTVLLPAVTEDTPVQCPNWKLTCTSDDIEDACDTDQDCLEEKRCCDVCGRKCFEPETLAKLTQCPVLIEFLLEGQVTLDCCESNQDCDPEQKCCDRCGRKICSVSGAAKKYPTWTHLFPNLPWTCDESPREPMEAGTQD